MWDCLLPLNLEKNNQHVVSILMRKEFFQLQNHNDVTGEITKDEFLEASKLSFSFSETDIKDHSIYIVTVPTPINEQKNQIYLLWKLHVNLLQKI